MRVEGDVFQGVGEDGEYRVVDVAAHDGLVEPRGYADLDEPVVHLLHLIQFSI